MTPGDQRADRPLVLLFGPHLAALGVLRVLARRGVPAYVVDETTNVIVRSRAGIGPPSATLRRDRRSRGAGRTTFARSSLPRAVLIACSDHWALAVSGLPRDLPERFPASIAPHDCDRGSSSTRIASGRWSSGSTSRGHGRMPIREPARPRSAPDEDLAVGLPEADRVAAPQPPRSRRRASSSSRASRRVGLVEQARAAGITFMLQE